VTTPDQLLPYAVDDVVSAAQLASQGIDSHEVRRLLGAPASFIDCARAGTRLGHRMATPIGTSSGAGPCSVTSTAERR
jgi:hypothetical protein